MAANKSLTFNIFGKDKSASKALHGVGASTGRLQSQFLKLGGVIAGVFALKRVVAFGKVAVQEFAAAQASQERLTDAYARFPKIADVNIRALRSLNTELQNKTRFDDDELAAAQSSLAQYNLTGKQIEKLTPLLADFAAKTGKDLPSAAAILGKALLGQGKGLKAIGVNFKDTKTAAGNYAELVDVLSDKVGGFAEKEGKTYIGSLAILGNQYGELKEKIGGLFAPALERLVALMGDKVLPIFDRLVVKIGPRVTAFLDAGADKAGMFLDALERASQGDYSGIKDLAADLSKVSPGFAALGSLATTLQPIMPVLATAFGDLGTALADPDVATALQNLVVTALPALVDVLIALTPLIPPIADALTNVFVPALVNSQAPVSALIDLLNVIKGDKSIQTWAASVSTSGTLLGGAMNAMVAAIGGAVNIALGAFNAIYAGWRTLLAGFGVSIPGVHLSFKTPSFGTGAGYTQGGGAGTGTSRTNTRTKFAEGGVVSARPGGMDAVIGEGRYDEAVLPLSPQVLSQLGSGSGGDTYVFHIGTLIGDDDRAMQRLQRKFQNAGKRGQVSGSFA